MEVGLLGERNNLALCMLHAAHAGVLAGMLE